MSSTPPILIALIGYTGNVGSALLERIRGLPQALQPRLSGVANSRSAYRFDRPILVDELESALLHGKPAALSDVLRFDAPASFNETIARHEQHPLRLCAMVDCTANEMISRSYGALLRDGTHVVTPNKLAFSRGYHEFQELKAAAAEGGARLDFETAVGAALPILDPLTGLVQSGDRVSHIEANLSGTLAYVLNRMQDDGTALSTAIAEAHGQGLTEPDPWQDLSGADVAKKLLILVRCAGVAAEPEQVQIAPLLTRSVDQQTFTDFDAQWAARVQEARRLEGRLVYRARFDGQKLSVEPALVAPRDPLATGRARDNVIVLQSQLYHPEALIIRGPGAGAHLTANGVLMGLLRIHREATRVSGTH
jgi:bifunctional aspartokinase / homoserine dehydrogenase 1